MGFVFWREELNYRVSWCRTYPVSFLLNGTAVPGFTQERPRLATAFLAAVMLSYVVVRSSESSLDVALPTCSTLSCVLHLLSTPPSAAPDIIFRLASSRASPSRRPVGKVCGSTSGPMSPLDDLVDARGSNRRDRQYCTDSLALCWKLSMFLVKRRLASGLTDPSVWIYTAYK